MADNEQLFELASWVETDAKKLDDIQEKHLLIDGEKERVKKIIADIQKLRHDIQKRIHKD